MGERLSARERGLFRLLTQRDREPLKPVEEFVAVIGRRGGKSRALAVAVRIALITLRAATMILATLLLVRVI
jgi:hypothetical protein